MPGRNPSGTVGVQVRPPSNVVLTPQPSLKFQSLLPVIMFAGLAGLIATGVSFCAVVSAETSTTVDIAMALAVAPALADDAIRVPAARVTAAATMLVVPTPPPPVPRPPG